MTGFAALLRFLPRGVRKFLVRRRELLKFVLVGGTCFVITNVVNYGLKLTVLTGKPVTALAVATLVATVVSYVLNREWSFRTRGGRERRHEAALFFLMSAISLGLGALPLAVSRYVLHLHTPEVGLVTQEIADYVSGMIVGTLLGTAFRWVSFRKWVFPQEDAHPGRVAESDETGSRAA
ncbi:MULTISPECIES: GtrA family protein [Amycolatopsis]|uniref:GtrA family protein n=1 Tax=Amycolatopsis thermalba TaxID=944492 RepID=A0ABY4NPH1_9PSEU|nr:MULTISPECIES: GtrA family protein [Amycolatopsis]OXM68178.1 sugar translocase [Amycolatopsis sp. KNN50.9b]UQS22605.1 GtrA family protein [Amycolatopsis thermalba]